MDILEELGIQRWCRRNLSKTPSVNPAGEPQRLISVNQAGLESTSLRAEQEPVSRIDSWADIERDLAGNSACLACRESHPVLGQGPHDAKWVFLIYAPSNQDVTRQKLLSGRAGDLFGSLLQALGLKRELVYLTSVFKCPASEAHKLSASCSDLVLRELALIKPKKILVFGEFAAKAILRSNDSLSTLRPQIHRPRSMVGEVGVTHSVTEMLANPILKAQVWEDVCRLLKS